MKDRVIKFLKHENITATKFADEIGVQRSSVSHILSGRNNPGFEFIQKILSRYKFINAEWLVMGTGNMVKTIRQGDLFENITPEIKIQAPVVANDLNIETKNEQKIEPVSEEPDKQVIETSTKKIKSDGISSKQIEKVVILYTDKSFTSYIPDQE